MKVVKLENSEEGKSLIILEYVESSTFYSSRTAASVKITIEHEDSATFNFVVRKNEWQDLKRNINDLLGDK